MDKTTQIKLKLSILLIPAVAFLVVSCGAEGDHPGYEFAPQMYHSTAYEPLKQVLDREKGTFISSSGEDVGEFYNGNPNNPHEMSMRDPVPNTVRRSKYGFLPYRIPKDSLKMAARLLKNPLDSTQVVIDHGAVLYSRFCQHCHGTNGKGDGLVGERIAGVPTYSSAAIKNKPGGHIFHVITHGKGRMGSHSSQLSVEERWAITRYVQVLQKQ
jgi:mono/diheme cytochrome c family protein